MAAPPAQTTNAAQKRANRSGENTETIFRGAFQLAPVRGAIGGIEKAHQQILKQGLRG
jgi:hypothetical protein